MHFNAIDFYKIEEELIPEETMTPGEKSAHGDGFLFRYRFISLYNGVCGEWYDYYKDLAIRKGELHAELIAHLHGHTIDSKRSSSND